MDANEQKARELLAAEYAKAYAEPFGAPIDSHAIAVRVIAKALAQQVPADGEVAGVRDTLIVAANNPVSHGGLEGLRKIMRAQAARLSATPQAPQPVVSGTIGQQAVDGACNCPGGSKPASLHAPNCPVRTTENK